MTPLAQMAERDVALSELTGKKIILSEVRSA
jgi:hypothetical protein